MAIDPSNHPVQTFTPEIPDPDQKVDQSAQDQRPSTEDATADATKSQRAATGGEPLDSPPDSPVQVVKIPVAAYEGSIAEEITSIIQLTFEAPPIGATRLDSGTQYDFEDGTRVDVGDDCIIIVTRPGDQGASAQTVHVYGDDPQTPVGNITFAAVAGHTASHAGDVGRTYSFLDPVINQNIAHDVSASPEDLDRLVSMGLHLSADGIPDGDILEALFSNPALSQDALTQILMDEGVDGIYLQFTEEDPSIDIEIGALWSEADGMPTPLGETVINLGGWEKFAAVSSAESTLEQP